MKEFQLKSRTDGMLLQGYHWRAEQPVAVMSLVHGFGEHAGRYAKLAQHLNSHGISVVAVDLRGHGQTGGPRGVARRYADLTGDVETLVEESARLYPELPQFLFGHSLGGGLVLLRGLTTESDSLAGYLVSAPLILPKKRVPKLILLFAKLIRYLIPNGTMPIPVSGKEISTIPEEQERYETDPLNHNRLGFGLGVGMIAVGEDLYAEADQWDKPLGMWHSKDDQITEFEASEHFAAEAQSCEFTPFDVVQHEMHHDRNQAEVYQLMIEFMLNRIQEESNSN